jgi:phosphoribosyl-ATP pyrophosphohydrolase
MTKKAETSKKSAPQGADDHILDALFRTIQSRKRSKPENSWTAALMARGVPKIAQKTGEEAVETVIAAMAGDKKEIAAESADLLYHLLVLWAATGVKPKDVWSALEKRRGVSGVIEKSARKS